MATLRRAVVAPLLLIATVALSYAASLCLCALLFQHAFGFAGLDNMVPLLFLVPLGVDYNIFLDTLLVRSLVVPGAHAADRAAGLVAEPARSVGRRPRPGADAGVSAELT